METDLANAQLQALTMQLHPHFLFNTLHSISTLISEEPAAAQEMVLKLSDLLRATLSKIETPEVSLRQELELLDCYLSIEQTRFKDRLQIVRQIDPAALPCAVPTMILQPLVENAVRHGIGKHKQADEISIVGRRENGLLLLEVINRAGHMENGADTARGIGLSNTRARLEQLYGNAHSLAIVNREGGGVAVKLSFPASDNASAATASKA
jgi:LytS/YehU family sensor histidine kinase